MCNNTEPTSESTRFATRRRSELTDYCVLTVLYPTFLQHKSFQTLPCVRFDGNVRKEEVDTSQALTTGRREGSAHYHTKTYKGALANQISTARIARVLQSTMSCQH